MNRIRPKHCKRSTRKNRCVTQANKPNQTHSYWFPVENKTASNFHHPFTFINPQMEHFLWMRHWACGKYFLCIYVKASGRGACVYTCMHNSFLWPVTSLRLMVRNVQQGGNLSDFFKTRVQNMPALKQYSHHLEGAVGRVDEPELSDVASWEAVDRGTTVASLHQADRLCWEKEEDQFYHYCNASF